MNGTEYQKMDKYEHSNRCLNLKTGQIEEHALMIWVEKIEKPAPKPAVVKSPPVSIRLKRFSKDLNEPKPPSDSF